LRSTYTRFQSGHLPAVRSFVDPAFANDDGGTVGDAPPTGDAASAIFMAD